MKELPKYFSCFIFKFCENFLEKIARHFRNFVLKNQANVSKTKPSNPRNSRTSRYLLEYPLMTTSESCETILTVKTTEI